MSPGQQQVEPASTTQQQAREPSPGGAMEQGPEQAPEKTPNAMERFGEVVKKPAVGASIAGTLVLGAAAAFGVLEAAVAAGAAYAAYLALRRRKASQQSSARSPAG
jgi:hypothetical protein